MNEKTEHKHSINCAVCDEIVDERECPVEYHSGGEVCKDCVADIVEGIGNDLAICIMCDKAFTIGEDGNELGFCLSCQEDKDFPYDLDAYYEDHDADKVAFKGFETMDRGLLEPYRKKCEVCKGTMRVKPVDKSDAIADDGLIPCPRCEGEGN